MASAVCLPPPASSSIRRSMLSKFVVYVDKIAFGIFAPRGSGAVATDDLSSQFGNCFRRVLLCWLEQQGKHARHAAINI